MDLKTGIEKLINEDFNNRQFELDITSLTNELVDEDIKLLCAILKSDKDVLEQRFIAFFIVVTYYRRRNRYDLMTSTFNTYRNLFSYEKFPILEHLELLVDAQGIYDETLFFDLLKRAKRLSQKDIFKNHPGVLHHFAELCATYFEINDDKQDLEIQMSYLTEAKTAVINAIGYSKATYAKFYATQGRILTLLKEYDEAYRSFDFAIHNEDHRTANYDVVIARYREYLMSVKESKKRNELDLIIKKFENKVQSIDESYQKELAAQEDKFKTEIKEIRGNQFKFIAIFAGFLSFILGSLDIVANASNAVEVMKLFIAVYFISLGLIFFFVELATNSHKTAWWKWLLYVIPIGLGIGVLFIV